MANFWDNLSGNIPQQNKNNGFDLQGFMQFAKQMKGKDPNAVLQQMANSGKYTQEQINNAKTQGESICQMLKGLGMIK